MMGEEPSVMAASGVSTICRTLDRMVITDTYRSPPVAASTLLQLMVTRLLVSCIMKPAVPRLTMSRIRASPASRSRKGSRRTRYSARRCRKPSRNTADKTWDSTVAAAAPATPMPKAKMKRGSSTRLATAPITTLDIPTIT